MFEARSAIIIRRVLVFLVMGVAIGTVTARAFDPAREARFEMLERHHAHLQTSNQKLIQENQRLDAELRGLETTDRGWEAVARREHGLLMPGEVIFRFPVAQKRRAAAVTQPVAVR
jgi:cell division protein FtsB